MGYLNEDGLATLVGKVKGQVVQLTQAEYMQIPDSEKNFNNKIYFVEDEEFSWKIDDEPTLNSDGLAKSGGIYTYTSKIGSGTLTTTAQTIIPAINELDAAIDDLNTGLIVYRDYTATTGTSQYQGYYFADIGYTLAGYTLISASNFGSTSNRPSFVQVVTASNIRAYCSVQETAVTVRCVYIKS